MDFEKTIPLSEMIGDLGGAAADVDDHVGGGFVDRETDADRGGHGLGNGDDVAGAGVEGGVFDGAFLDLRDAGRDGDDDAGRVRGRSRWCTLRMK